MTSTILTKRDKNEEDDVIPLQELKLWGTEDHCVRELAHLLHRLAVSLGNLSHTDYYLLDWPDLLTAERERVRETVSQRQTAAGESQTAKQTEEETQRVREVQVARETAKKTDREIVEETLGADETVKQTVREREGEREEEEEATEEEMEEGKGEKLSSCLSPPNIMCWLYHRLRGKEVIIIK